MSLPPRPAHLPAAALFLALLWSALACTGPGSTDGGELSEDALGPPDTALDTAFDAAVDAVQPDGATDDDGSHGGPCVAAGAAPGSNLHLIIDGDATLTGGLLRVELVDASAAGLAIFRPPAAAVLYDGPIAALPMDWFGAAPAGDWAVRAAAFGKAGDTETILGGGVACDAAGIATPTIAAATCTTLQLPLLSNDEVESAKDLCGGIGKTGQALFQPMTTVLTPPTQAGGAHLMNAVTSGERLWVAASEDGFVSFDFPAPPAVPGGKLNNWQVHGQPVCNRLHRVGTTVFCASRRSNLGALTFDPLTFAIKGTTNVDLAPDSHSEGMADRDGMLYVADHSRGLTRLLAAAPHTLSSPITPKGALDAWDVVALPAQRLGVANGDHGLLLLQPGATSAAPWQVVAQAALAGVSAHLAWDKDQLAVGALNGGLHLLRVDGAGQLHLQGSLKCRGLVHGVAFADELVLAAASGHLLAVQRPASDASPAGALVARGLEPSYYHAMDIDRVGQEVVASEFQAVRQLHIVTDAPAGPLLDAPLHVMAPLAAVGGLIKGEFTLRNAGSETLHIKQVVFTETPGSGGSQQVLAKGLEVAPGKDVTIEVAVTKKAKGVIAHEILVLSDDPAHPNMGLTVLEVAQLRPGDSLPDVTYQTAAGKSVSLKGAFAGSVGVLLIAAHACPVAFNALSAARRDLAPYLNQIKVIGIDPWDKPAVTAEAQIYDYGFDMLFSALTTNDDHGWSEVLDLHFGQPILAGPPMPVVYVVGADGKIVLAQWGYESGALLAAVDAALGGP